VSPLEQPATIDLGVVARLGAGVAVVVATPDLELRPTLARAWHPRIDAGGRRVTLCVEAPLGSPIRANLERRCALAATFVRPTTYRSVQVKGTVRDVRPSTAEERRAVADHNAIFVDEVVEVGVPARVADRFLDDRELLAVTVDVRELYDQTPGPAAGERL